jgi:hypothetical protein
VSTAAASRETGLGGTAGRWEGLRRPHPVRVLRWLRGGVLVVLAVAALLQVVVSVGTDRQIGDARRTRQAIEKIKTAHETAGQADTALSGVFENGEVTLLDTGNDFANDMARVSTDITSAAGGNAAGERGVHQITYVQEQLTICMELAQLAVSSYRSADQDYGAQPVHAALAGPQEKDPETSAKIPDTGGLVSSLGDLERLERAALADQRHSRWLDPTYVWAALLGPVFALLLLAVATGYVVARHFRRHVDLRLPLALLVTAATTVTTGLLAGNDERHLSARPLAGHPVTMVLGLCLLAAAAVLGYLSYRERLLEYRFRRHDHQDTRS